MAQLLDYLSEKYQQESVDEVNRRLLELSSLFEISQLLNESLDLHRVLNNVLFIPMGRLMIPRGAIVLLIKDRYEVVMAKGLPAELKTTTFSIEDIPEDCFQKAQHKNCHESDDLPKLKAFAVAGKLDIAIPFISNQKPLGFMLFGKKLSGTDFSEDELSFLNSLANLSATTIQNALQVAEINDINEEMELVNKRLQEKIQELRTLSDIGKGLSATLDEDRVLKLLSYSLMGKMLITKYCILLEKGGRLNVHDVKGLNRDAVDRIAGMLLETGIGDNALTVETLGGRPLGKLCLKNNIHVLIPMQHQEKLVGYILLGSKINQQPYDEDDLEFLTTLLSQAIIAIENARLFQETLEKQRLEEELNVARTIQKQLLPKRIPTVAGYEIFGMNNSSKQVGGDYYDVIPIDEHRIALAIADVSGKGVPASLLMANIQAGLRVMMTADLELATAVGRLNSLIHANTGLDKFITCFIGILDTRDHTFQYVNAGHNNPHYFTTDGEQKFLDVGGIILGIMSDYAYHTDTLHLQKGELVITYTDGVNEALDPDGEEFGDERLNALTATLADKPVADIVNTIWETIDTFSAGAQQADDVTMLVLKRLQ